MRKKLFIIAFMALLFFSYSNAEDILWVWTKQAGGNGGSNGNYVTIDSNDNSFVIWTFVWSTTIFGANLVSSGNKDIFVAKLDSNKNVLWVKKSGWPDIDNVNAITVDGSGNIYVVWSFTSEADLFWEHILSTEWFDSDFFLAKLDTDGNTIRVKTSTWPKNDYAKSVKVDASGNIYVVWEFENTASIFWINLTSVWAALDLFLAKLDSNGNAIRAKKSWNDKHNYAYDLVLDGSNIYVAGSFFGTDNLFGISLDTTARWDSDVFVAKLNASGNALRAKRWWNDMWEAIRSLTIHNNNVYVAGSFSGANNNMFGTNLNSNGWSDWYLVRLDTNGNVSLAKTIWWTSNDSVVSTSLDLDGNIYLVGNFMWTVNFFGANISSSWWSDIFISKTTTNWTGIWTDKIGWTWNDNANYIALNNDFNVYVVWTFQWTSNIFWTSLTAADTVDVFLAKLLPFSSIVVIPNSVNIATIEAEFTSKWYTKTSNYLLWNRMISLKNTNGLIPNTLNIKNGGIELNLPQNIQFKKADNTTNYTGTIEPPKHTVVASVSNESVVSSLSVGSVTEPLKIQWWIATITVPTTELSVGESINIYSSEDNWANWTLHTNWLVEDILWTPTVQFTTNHFTEFAITVPLSVSWTFTINSDAASTTSNTVTLNISTTPTANYMRFANDTPSGWSAREAYSTSKSWTLSAGYANKTVYAQFDVNNDQISDIETSDTITYSAPWGGGSSQWQLTLEIGHGTWSCQYGTSLNLGAQVAWYSAKIFSWSFASSFRCEDKNGTIDDRVLSIQSSLLTNASNSIYTIPATSIELQNSPAHIVNGDCAIYTGTTSRTPINSPTSILGKNHDMGAICKIQADTVTLKVTTDINQAVGIYTGTLTIDVPNFN